MREFTAGEVLVPGGRWAWAQVLPALLVTALALNQAVDPEGASALWWVLALAGLAFALGHAAQVAHQLTTRSSRSIRVDAHGLLLPEHGPVAWSQVRTVTTTPGDKQERYWSIVLDDGTPVGTGFTRGDSQLRESWERHRSGGGRGR